MTNLLFSGLVLGGSVVAGFVGSLTGLGGGVVILPMLTIAFGVNMRYAIGASLISVIATSSGAAAAYVRDGFSNVRIGMMLEIATAAGAIGGAALAAYVPTSKLAILLGVVLIGSVFAPVHREPDGTKPSSPETSGGRLSGSYPGPQGPVQYTARRVPLGFGMMGVAGMLSGLLGIGSGAVKVLAMDLAMGLPFKVSTTTSNFMIGVTAAASAGIYLHRGYVDPQIAMPVTLGVVAGSLTGATLLKNASVHGLRMFFRAVIFALGIEMIYNGWTGRI